MNGKSDPNSNGSNVSKKQEGNSQWCTQREVSLIRRFQSSSLRRFEPPRFKSVSAKHELYKELYTRREVSSAPRLQPGVHARCRRGNCFNSLSPRDGKPLKHRVRKISTLLLAVLLSLPACKQKPSSKSPPPPLVEVAPVTQADVPIYHDWVGVLDGLVNAQIRAQVTGYLLTQNYREGDPIKKGDLLFEIDPRPFKAALDQAKGVLAQAEAKFGKTELDVKRYAPLVKDKAISQEEYDDAVQANLEAKAAVVSATAQVEQAQLNLEFTKITSPIEGIASIARAQIGDLVGPASGELTTVSTIDPIKAYYNVTEQAYINFTKLFVTESDRYGRLRQLEIDLILTDGTVYAHKGKIFAADRQIGLTTGALRLEALFPNPDSALRPGEFARIRVKFDLKHDTLLVPQRAVSELQGSYQVAVVEDDNTIHIQPVRVGDRTGNLWAIEEGLRPGQRVVVEGIQKIRDGIAVSVTNFVADQMVQTKPAATTK